MSSELNLIYYGPPGTGKTYATARTAVELIDKSAPDDRVALMSRYKELQDKGLIEFVTFHQSYSYEEFVEGIRPVFDDEDDEATDADGAVRYECKQGVFRRLCAPSDASMHRVASADFDPAQSQVWKMSLGNTRKQEDDSVYDECIEKNRILLGYGRGLDYTGCNTREQILQKLRTVERDAKANDYAAIAVHRFKNKMKVGDLVVISHGNHRFRAIARVTGPYQRLRDSEYGQMRPVEWLLVTDESIPRENIMSRRFSQATIYKLSPPVLYVDKLRELLASDQRPSNRVLIIDEINRGNIAKILGELITLIEPDKRRGAENELRAKLPYSGDDLTVPANLYIIGTMNTADRSIALLDTALRRRFQFREMLPDPAVIRKWVGAGGLLDGVDVARLLEVMNDRIELLYDRDHRLGHSYFVKVHSLDELRDAMLDRVIPLLQEYFHGRWERICLVLGCPYDEDGKPQGSAPHVIRARALRAIELLGSHDEVGDKLQYEVHPEFVGGSGPVLRPFFESILQISKPPSRSAAE